MLRPLTSSRMLDSSSGIMEMRFFWKHQGLVNKTNNITLKYLAQENYSGGTNFTFTGADVRKEGESAETLFRYPSYVQHIMGDIFSLGFGPFRSELFLLTYSYVITIKVIFCY